MDFKEELLSIKYIGEKTANDIIDNFSREEFIEKLFNDEMQYKLHIIREAKKYYQNKKITTKSEEKKQKNIENELSSKDFLKAVRSFALTTKAKENGYLLHTNLPNIVILSRHRYSNKILTVRGSNVNFYNIRERKILKQFDEFSMYEKFFQF